MTDALELLKHRRSIPASFLGPPAPSKAELDQILTIAARVPDHGKLAPWRFIVFLGEARRQAGESIAARFRTREPEADQKRIEEERNRLAQAPLVVAVVSTAAPHPKIPEWEQVLSAGNAAMSLILAVHALGYAANWTTGWIAYDEEAGRLLGLRPGERIVAFIHIGTPTVPPVERPRPELADIVTYWTPPSP
jgi:nitroreductase